MKVIAINGSPRKNGNTATLLKHALEGAKSRGVDTMLVHLYDMNYTGCTSCFACKRKDGKNYGKCAFQDDLSNVLKEIEKADAIIMGSPIYFGSITGQMMAFLERLMFPYTTYTEGYKAIFGRNIKTGFIYTMNVSEEQLLERGYQHAWKITEGMLQHIFGSCEALYVYDTYQFDDYSKYVVTIFDEEHKAKVKKEQFPKDCHNTFEMGCRFAKQ